MRKRSDMALDILKALDRESLIITHLGRQANTEYTNTMSITEVLMDHGLVERSLLTAHPYREQDKRVKYLYHITDCGTNVLKRGIRLCWTLGFDFNLTNVSKERYY